MIKSHFPAVTGGLKIRIWSALRVEAQKRGLPVAGFVRRVFQHAMRHAAPLNPPVNRHLSSDLPDNSALPGLQDQLNKS